MIPWLFEMAVNSLGILIMVSIGEFVERHKDESGNAGDGILIIIGCVMSFCMIRYHRRSEKIKI